MNTEQETKPKSTRMQTSTTTVSTIVMGCIKSTRKGIENVALHLGLVISCGLYVLAGAFCFYNLEKSTEIYIRNASLAKLEVSRVDLLEALWNLTQNESLSKDELLNMSDEMLDSYVEQLFEVFGDTYTATGFEANYIDANTSVDVWTTASSLLLATTTLIPVGYGFVTARTTIGRVFNVLYSMVGMPLFVVTLGDVSRFIGLGLVRIHHKIRELFKGVAIPAHLVQVPMSPVVGILVTYVFMGGVLYSLLNLGSLLDSVYFALVTILTIGYGDIHPPSSYAVTIGYIVLGTVITSTCIDLIAVVAIDQIHYMGRQVGKAKELAEKVKRITQQWKSNLGALSQMAMLGNMGIMANQQNGGVPQIKDTLAPPKQTEQRGSFSPKDMENIKDVDGSMDSSLLIDPPPLIRINSIF